MGLFSQYKQLKLHCFSPPVMIATFMIELALALFTIWRYRLAPVSRLALSILVCLAAFQLAEFTICTNGALQSEIWARIGYAAITLLPPLGIHLAYTIAGDKRGRLVMPAYLSAAAFIGFFLLAGSAFTSQVCHGNYVIFEVLPQAGWLYGLYYYGWLLASMWLAGNLIKTAKPAIAKSLKGLIIGYAAFIVPTTAVNLLDPATINGIPSIMCGFAVLYALILVGWVLPQAKAGKRA